MPMPLFRIRFPAGAAAATPGAAGTFRDTFNRADTASGHDLLGVSSDGTKTWLVPDQQTTYSPGLEFGWAIRSNAATLTTLAGGLTVAYVTGLGANGRAKITVKTPSANAPFYVLGRYADHDNHVGFLVDVTGISSQHLLLYKRVAASTTNLLDLSLDFVNYQAGDTLELEITSGDVARIYWNGVQQGADQSLGAGVLAGNLAWGMAVNYNSLGDWDGALEQYDWTAG